MAQMSLRLALVTAVGGLGLAAFPDTARRLARRFPRSRSAAVVLTALDLLWVTGIIRSASLGRFEYLKTYLVPAAVISFLAIVLLMDELLAPRALGGLLLLCGNPVLKAARWHASPWRLVVVGLVYLWVVAGMWLVLSPWRFRLTVEKLSTNFHIRLVGAAVLALAGLLGVLAVTVY